MPADAETTPTPPSMYCQKCLGCQMSENSGFSPLLIFSAARIRPMVASRPMTQNTIEDDQDRIPRPATVAGPAPTQSVNAWPVRLAQSETVLAPRWVMLLTPKPINWTTNTTAAKAISTPCVLAELGEGPTDGTAHRGFHRGLRPEPASVRRRRREVGWRWRCATGRGGGAPPPGVGLAGWWT